MILVFSNILTFGDVRVVIKHSFIRGVIAAVALFGSAANSFANDEDLCAPFKNSEVDQSLVAMMLAAAEEGGLYRIQSSTSSVGFCANSLIGRVEAEFKVFQGGVSLLTSSPEHQHGQTLVKVDTGSLTTNGKLIQNLIKSKGFLDVENFPEILFVSTGLTWTSSTEGVLEGLLTLHGTTRPVTFTVKLTGSNDSPLLQSDEVQVKATTTIRPSEFGIDTLPEFVTDSVNLCMRVNAVRYSS
jgi:polyisoprenoid-binding protein YceI